MSRYQALSCKTIDQQPLKKQWQIVSTRFGHATQKLNNNMLEGAYMQALKKAKQLLTQNTQTVFERDQRKDSSENAFIMHSFLCSSFYFQLECTLSCNYKVECAFYNCPVEQEVRKLLTAYPFQERCIEVSLKPDFTTFYRKVLQVQNKHFLFLL